MADEVVAGAGAVDDELPPEPGGDLLQRCGQYLFVVRERV